MLAQYGRSTMNQWKVYEWLERFKEGRTDVADKGHSGCLSTSCTQQPINRSALSKEDMDNDVPIGCTSGNQWWIHICHRTWLSHLQFLKVALHCCRFTSDDEVKKVALTCLPEQPNNFSAGIQRLVEGYNMCIVLLGYYVKKWCVHLLTVTYIKAVKRILPLLFWFSLIISPHYNFSMSCLSSILRSATTSVSRSIACEVFSRNSFNHVGGSSLFLFLPLRGGVSAYPERTQGDVRGWSGLAVSWNDHPAVGTAEPFSSSLSPALLLA